MCDEPGLTRNGAKRLIRSISGGIQGGELNGETGVIRVAPDKLLSFIGLSLGLLSGEVWKEFWVRRWAGKAAFIAAFRRPLFSILDKIFDLITRLTREDCSPGGAEVDEVMSFLVLGVQGEAQLRAQVSKEVTCADASPTGGGSAVATQFQEKSLQIPSPVEPSDSCVRCGNQFAPGEGRVKYPCPRACGEFGCSVVCAQGHFESGGCRRQPLLCQSSVKGSQGPIIP